LADRCSYVFLGCSRQRDASAAAKAFEIEAGSKVGIGKGGLMTPISSPLDSNFNFAGKAAGRMYIPDFSLGPSLLENGANGLEQTIHEVGAPLSPFHYQLRKVSPSTGVPVGNRLKLVVHRPGGYRTWKRRYISSSGLTSMAG